MIALTRTAPPQILADKAGEWTAKYQTERATSPGARPLSERYAHPKVKLELRRMSQHKCFYCEEQLGERAEEVDHHIECAERPDLAFEWTNLYLSCRACNRDKAPNTSIPVANCVDPCAAGASPEEHLTFVGDEVTPREGSPAGRETIRKYNLNRGDLCLARSRALRKLATLDALLQKHRADRGGGDPLPIERAEIRALGDSSRAFSLMLREAIDKLGY